MNAPPGWLPSAEGGAAARAHLERLYLAGLEVEAVAPLLHQVHPIDVDRQRLALLRSQRDARQQIASVNAYIEALRDFWLAEASLDLALTGKSPGPMAAGPLPTSPGAAAAGH